MLPLLLSRPAFLNQTQNRYFPIQPLLSDLLTKYHNILLFYHNSIVKSICNRLPEQDFSAHNTNFRVRHKKQREPTRSVVLLAAPVFLSHSFSIIDCKITRARRSFTFRRSHHFIGCYRTISQHIFINAPFLFTIRHFIGAIRHFIGIVETIRATIQAVGIIAPFFSCAPVFVHGN